MVESALPTKTASGAHVLNCMKAKPRTYGILIHHHRHHHQFFKVHSITTKQSQTQMADFNPIHYLQSAWNDAQSNWGKACAFLFYAYIWLQMIWSIEIVIAPKAGWDCYYQGVSDYAAELWVMFLRAMNVMQFGFFLYAHREGIKVWNVAMVFAFNAVLTWINLAPDFPKLDGTPSPAACDWETMWTVVWVFFWWTVMFLLCSILEEGSKSRVTTSETAPMVN